MLKIEGLCAAYGRIQVLKKVSIKVPKGEVVSIIGANGAGKSTLLKTISGLMKTDKGRILYKDRDIAGLSASRIVGLGISQVPEGRQIFPIFRSWTISISGRIYTLNPGTVTRSTKRSREFMKFFRFLKNVQSRSPAPCPVESNRCWPLPGP
jgi:ABC-type branched-subunit amino acid transport system ATPase component